MKRYSVILAKNNDLRPGVAAGIIDNPSLSRIPIAEFASESVAFHVCALMNDSTYQLPAVEPGNKGRTRVGQ
jgi:hypothetical protein